MPATDTREFLRYHYYIVDNAYPARVDTTTLIAESLGRDGAWSLDDLLKVTEGGCEVTERRVLTFWSRH